MNSPATSSPSSYFVPKPSRWPICGVASAVLLVTGMILMFNSLVGGAVTLMLGFASLFATMYGWWGDVTRESETGLYKEQEDMAFRWGMSWFIFSEVMFFGAFFGALFYTRFYAVPDLATGANGLIWPGFEVEWPSSGPYFRDRFETIPAFGIPAINTLILLTSGMTVTWAHWALKMNNRTQLNLGLAVTVALGIVFLVLQVGEYGYAYSELNLTLESGIYGSTFFMLTGFHGLHVTIGTVALIVILARCMRGHFKPDRHFGFEGVAWYWHFVDVVWLMLFVIVYWI